MKTRLQYRPKWVKNVFMGLVWTAPIFLLLGLLLCLGSFA